jgi:hypothetical protein
MSNSPRTDAVNSATSTQSFEGLCRSLETELAQAEAKSVALRKLLGKCKPAIELVLRDAVNLQLEGMAGVYRTLRDEMEVALKEGKK